MLGESEALPTVSSDLADHSADPASLVKKALQMSLAEADATRDSAPAGLDTALRDLDSNPSANLVAVSFLKSGLKVWYAYFRAISRNSGLESLAAHLPPPTIARIAADISATVPHQSVADRIERTFTVSRRGKSRTETLRHILRQVQPDLPPDDSAVSAEPVRSVNVPCSRRSEASSSSSDVHHIEQRASKRVRSDNEQYGRQIVLHNPVSMNLAEYVRQNSDAGNPDAEVLWQGESGRGAGYCAELTGELPLVAAGFLEAWSTTMMDFGYFAWPRALNLPIVFPHDMCTSIVKSDGLASVVLSMKDPTNCYMTLEILPTSVQLVATDLFGVRIRFLSGQRHVYFENGATIHSAGVLELRGADATKIDNILGLLVAKAFRDSPRRVEESFSGELLSSAVRFEVADKAESSGRLSIILDVEQSITICRRLSGNMY